MPKLKRYSKKDIRQDYRSKLKQEKQESLNVSGITGRRKEGFLAPFYKQGKYRLKTGGQGTPTSPLTIKIKRRPDDPIKIPPVPMGIISKSFKSDPTGKGETIQTGQSEIRSSGHTDAESLRKAADLQSEDIAKQKGGIPTKMSKKDAERAIKYFNVTKEKTIKGGSGSKTISKRFFKEGDVYNPKEGKNVMTKYRKGEKEEEQQKTGRKGFRELYAQKKAILKKEKEEKLHQFDVRKGERKAKKDFPSTRPQK